MAVRLLVRLCYSDMLPLTKSCNIINHKFPEAMLTCMCLHSVEGAMDHHSCDRGLKSQLANDVGPAVRFEIVSNSSEVLSEIGL
jgi:hypothetical protein